MTTSFTPIGYKLFCAIEAVLYVAYAAPDESTRSGDIAKWQGLPARYLEPLMQKLVRAGVLAAMRGPTGGYMLGASPERISLATICDVLKDEVSDDFDAPATALGQLVLMPVINGLQGETMQSLRKITLADLCRRAEKKRISTNPPAKKGGRR